MKIIFKDITIHNFMSISDAYVILENQGYVFIKGINNNVIDNSKSNGAGKSTLIEAILYCLTGTTIRDNKDVVNRTAKDACKITLNLEVDNHQYKIIRIRDKAQNTANLKVFVDGEDKSGKGIRDSSKILEEYLPEITPSLLSAVILLGQGLPQRFSNNTPSGRKEVLEQLSKSDFMIEDIKNKIAQRKEDLDSQLRKIQDTSIALKSQLEMNQEQLKRFQGRYEELEKRDFTQIEGLENQLQILELEYSKIVKEQEDLEEEEKSYTIQLQEHLRKAENDKETIHNKYQPQLEELHTQKISIDIERKKLQEEITYLDSVRDICPTCGQKIEGVVKIDTSKKKIELKEIQDKLDIISSDYLDLENKKTLELTTLKQSNEKISQNLQSTINNYSTSIKNYKIQSGERYGRIQELKTKITQLKTEQNMHTENILQLQSSITAIKNTIDEINSKVLYNNNEEQDINLRLQINSKMNTLAIRDFRGILLKELILYLDKKAKEYCKEIFNNEELVIELDKNNINIIFNTKSYEALSGGEKTRVDLIIQFALRDLLTYITGFHCNLLCLDECLDFLDEISINNVINFLVNQSQNIESLFFISHHEELNIPYDKILTIEKGTDGNSRIL